MTIGSDKILESMLKAVNSPTDEYVLTYEATTGDFEWQEMTTGGGGVGTASSTELLWNSSGNVDGTSSLTWNSTYNSLVTGDNGMICFGDSRDIRFDYDGTANALEIYDNGLGGFLDLVCATPNKVRIRDNALFTIGTGDDFQFSTDASGATLTVNNGSSNNIANLSSNGSVWFAGYVMGEGQFGLSGTSSQPSNIAATYQIWFDTDNDKLCWVDDDGQLHIAAEEPPPAPRPMPKPTVDYDIDYDSYGLTTQLVTIEYSPDFRNFRTVTMYYQGGSLVYMKPTPWKKYGIIRKLLIK